MEGWIKLHRKLLENPIVCKDADHLAVWTYLLLKATHRERDSIFKGERITLKPGQLIAGRKSIASFLKINEIKVQRILKLLENEHQIEQQTSNRNRLITILNWDLYQGNEQQDEQQMNNKRTTDEQQMNTYKNVKKDKNDKNIYIVIFDYWNSKKIIVHKKLTDKIKRKISGALDTHSPDELKKAIDNYHTVLTGDEYYWTYKWTLEDFLQRGLEKFLTDACFENYKKDKGTSQQLTKAPNKGNFDQRKYDNDYFDKLYKEV